MSVAAHRAFDVVVAAMLIVVLLPFFLLTALLVAIDVGSSPIRWQRRTNAAGRAYKFYSLRTMRPPPDMQRCALMSPQRLSAIGTGVRFLGLNNAPALYNVLTGNITLRELQALVSAERSCDPFG